MLRGLTLLITVMITACGSNPSISDFGATIDMSSSRTLDTPTLPATQMTAEVIFINDLITQDVRYRFEAVQRNSVTMDEFTLTLTPSRYQIATVCSVRNFHQRLAGLKNIEQQDSGQLWARFQTVQGTDLLLPVTQLQIDVIGGETITPVNISPIGPKECEVTYGDAPVNNEPYAYPTTQAFKEKRAKKMKLYN